MKLLIALLFTLSLPTFAFAKAQHKIKKYFELGTSFSLNTEKVNGVEEDSILVLQASKGYIFNNRWDVSLGLKYMYKKSDQTSAMNAPGATKQAIKPKSYAAQLAVKYIFKKRPGLIKRHHKTWITPYLGVAYQWRRFSPHAVNISKGVDVNSQTTEPGYIVSAGFRCFMTKNLAATWDLSYRKAIRTTQVKSSGAKLATVNIKEWKPSLSLVYFY